MSHSKPFSFLTPIITPTLHDHTRNNLVPWKIAINRSARAVFVEWNRFGFLFGVCNDTVWVVLNTPPGGVLRYRPDFPAPQLTLPPVLVLLPVTLSNAPRTQVSLADMFSSFLCSDPR